MLLAVRGSLAEGLRSARSSERAETHACIALLERGLSALAAACTSAMRISERVVAWWLPLAVPNGELKTLRPESLLGVVLHGVLGLTVQHTHSCKDSYLFVRPGDQELG